MAREDEEVEDGAGIRVIEFTNFVNDIATIDLLLDPEAAKSARCKCLSKYLTELKVRSIVIEPEYTDAGYLVDYANYYSRCFEDYDRLTARLHFFTEEAAAVRSLFDDFIRYDEDSKLRLQKAYRGFVVIKPLPSTIIGRTCVSVYSRHDNDTGRIRKFPVLRTYKVNLFGLALEVESVAFQEQDNEVAACATTAIWFAFHALPGRFAVDHIPSPFEITDESSSLVNGQSLGEVTRRFPTNGLTHGQIEAKLRSEGLECIVRPLEPEDTGEMIQEYTSAYVRGGYPIIVTGKLYTSTKKDGDFNLAGGHAMTALGLAYDPAFKEGNWAGRLQRLFAHDDNIGPFASFRFEHCEPGEFEAQTMSASVNNAGGSLNVLDEVSRRLQPKSFEYRVRGYLANESGTSTVGRIYRRFVPSAFIVPVPPKVRMNYELVRLFAKYVETMVKADWERHPDGKAAPLISWSAVLRDVTSLRQRIYKATDLFAEDAREFLLSPVPRYMWRLKLTTNNDQGKEQACVDFIFDATALRQSGGLIGVLRYSHPFSAKIVGILLRWARRNDELEQNIELLPVLNRLRELFDDQEEHAEKA